MPVQGLKLIKNKRPINNKQSISWFAISLFLNRAIVNKSTTTEAFLSRNNNYLHTKNTNQEKRFSFSSSSSVQKFISMTSRRPELIDVDCNLLHSDLKSLKKQKGDQNANQTTTIGSNEAWLNILDEDAITEANIVAMVSPSSTIAESELFLKLYESHPPPEHIRIKTTIGVHPYHVNDDDLIYTSDGEQITMEEQRNKIRNAITSHWEESKNNDNGENHDKGGGVIAAIGECGLDASDGFPPLDLQIPWFQMQVEIASEFRMPLFVHERLAFHETIDILDKVLLPLSSTEIPIIIHCFTGTKEQCIEYIKRGYYVSISGYVLKESNENYSEVISCLEEGIIPLDKLMIETDAPYMGFKGCRQHYSDRNREYVSNLNSKSRKRLQQSMYPNVPSSLPMVLSKVTECLQTHDGNLTIDRVAKNTTANARKFFRL